MALGDFLMHGDFQDSSWAQPGTMDWSQGVFSWDLPPQHSPWDAWLGHGVVGSIRMHQENSDHQGLFGATDGWISTAPGPKTIFFSFKKKKKKEFGGTSVG